MLMVACLLFSLAAAVEADPPAALLDEAEAPAEVDRSQVLAGLHPRDCFPRCSHRPAYVSRVILCIVIISDLSSFFNSRTIPGPHHVPLYCMPEYLSTNVRARPRAAHVSSLPFRFCLLAF